MFFHGGDTKKNKVAVGPFLLEQKQKNNDSERARREKAISVAGAWFGQILKKIARHQEVPHGLLYTRNQYGPQLLVVFGPLLSEQTKHRLPTSVADYLRAERRWFPLPTLDLVKYYKRSPGVPNLAFGG